MLTRTKTVTCPFCGQVCTLSLYCFTNYDGAPVRHELALECPRGHMAPTQMLMQLWGPPQEAEPAGLAS